jgi:hypothetical protein
VGFILQYEVERARTGFEVDGSEIQSRSILPHPFHCPVIGWEIAWQFMANHADVAQAGGRCVAKTFFTHHFRNSMADIVPILVI